MKNIRCLIIDDDTDDREIFGIAIEGQDMLCDLKEFDSGLKALEALSLDSEFPDYIFLDLNMPLLSGKECLYELRRMPLLDNVKIIMYSTSSYNKDIDDSMQMGATHFLSKTADITRLSVILNNIFSGKALPFILS
jgi:DNA-binding NtrC family response regulator